MQFAHEKTLILQISDCKKNKSAELCVTKNPNNQ